MKRALFLSISIFLNPEMVALKDTKDSITEEAYHQQAALEVAHAVLLQALQNRLPEATQSRQLQGTDQAIKDFMNGLAAHIHEEFKNPELDAMYRDKFYPEAERFLKLYRLPAFNVYFDSFDRLPERDAESARRALTLLHGYYSTHGILLPLTSILNKKAYLGKEGSQIESFFASSMASLKASLDILTHGDKDMLTLRSSIEKEALRVSKIIKKMGI